MTVLRNFVGGSYTDSAGGETSPVVDPCTGEPYAYAPVSSAADVDAAMAAARDGFDRWRDATPAERQRALLRIADAVEARAGEIIAAECRNTGKPVELTRQEEMAPLLDELRFFAGAARVLEGRSAGQYLAGYESYVRREPIGICAQVTPWNYPMVMAVWKFAPAIAAGNAVVLKPADTTPVSTLLLAEIAAEFLPPGVLNVVCGDRDTGRALVAHPAPELVSITGSTRAGREVAAAAAADLKKVHLELGGTAPVVVFDDAGVEQTAAA
ncbi:MAG TPA: aldehyde dehydrogenase family protein, partial [Actinoplanes sp.]|nr:aldehyde dehydrogenase family protein [Actinoplanes sp.]